MSKLLVLNEKPVIVLGVHTNSAKTVLSALFVHALRAYYWKPIQTGATLGRDSQTITKALKLPSARVIDEAYCFTSPLSPHQCMAEEKRDIDFHALECPSYRPLVIETAGGILSPINNKHCMIDMVKKFDAQVVLAVRNYLGSINHTLLTMDYLVDQGVKIYGVFFSGASNPHSESFIVSRLPEDTPVFYLEEFKSLTYSWIIEQAAKIAIKIVV